MATFSSITKVVNDECLVKPSITLECRRFMPKDKRWTVTCRSGWPMDNPISVDRHVSRSRARELAQTFLREMTI
ncbi:MULTISPECIES: hypothetical protein [Vibrio]|uniref:hypothetical protein n=1 Tax=Vibrio TaxID=662 RepID=UPI00207574BB|nr:MULTISPECIES: hypothetical protein [Vibrio]USD35636.1 hypothetical protein J8Z27_22775 [Vibrio sp. SCSIO 43186]USD72760.1 hypothetical protein J4N41_22780 [Vibrio sp. SCSIO 43139]USD98965.1 hypothetical protein CTT30_23105 [Vibrio coralliilyticus]